MEKIILELVCAVYFPFVWYGVVRSNIIQGLDFLAFLLLVFLSIGAARTGLHLPPVRSGCNSCLRAGPHHQAIFSILSCGTLCRWPLSSWFPCVVCPIAGHRLKSWDFLAQVLLPPRYFLGTRARDSVRSISSFVVSIPACHFHPPPGDRDTLTKMQSKLNIIKMERRVWHLRLHS
jgi:hypothetical protein